MAVCLFGVFFFVAFAGALVAPEGVYSDKYGLTLLPTPRGWRPEQCVHTWPSGSRIEQKKGENRVKVTLPNGEVHSLPQLKECMRWDYDVPSVPSSFQDRRNPMETIPDGWLDYTMNKTDLKASKQYVYSFNATYTAPNTPATYNQQFIYYFIGAQNDDDAGTSANTILQPVMGYGYLENAKPIWNLFAMNCCPEGQSHHADYIQGFGPGDDVYAKIYQLGVNNGDWVIEGANAQGDLSTLQVAPIGRVFNGLYTSLETYLTKDNCDSLPSGTMTFSKLKASVHQMGGPAVITTPLWQNPSPTSACNGHIDVIDWDVITVKHN